jgi:hypothetical protein
MEHPPVRIIWMHDDIPMPVAGDLLVRTLGHNEPIPPGWSRVPNSDSIWHLYTGPGDNIPLSHFFIIRHLPDPTVNDPSSAVPPEEP